ncbi:hypothetical protein C7M84_009318 [Penaeus vannamei]|uniref:Uncharacterized protein n=1 Tax=Penaeus vannamei TaxID=6689 RepID=A0A423T781_PENVA|nr:hypothetical protein C7M84_009318 [Penaeus vannamei]
MTHHQRKPISTAKSHQEGSPRHFSNKLLITFLHQDAPQPAGGGTSMLNFLSNRTLRARAFTRRKRSGDPQHPSGGESPTSAPIRSWRGFGGKRSAYNSKRTIVRLIGNKVIRYGEGRALGERKCRAKGVLDAGEVTAKPGRRRSGDLRDESVDNYIRLVLEKFCRSHEDGDSCLGDSCSWIPWRSGRSRFRILTPHQRPLQLLSDGGPRRLPASIPRSRLHVVTVRVDGQYWADGLLLSIFPVFGNGPFYIQIVSTDVSGLGDVTVTPDDYLQVRGQRSAHVVPPLPPPSALHQIEDLQLTAEFDFLDAHFDNFLGGSFGEIMSDVLADLASAFLAGGAGSSRLDACLGECYMEDKELLIHRVPPLDILDLIQGQGKSPCSVAPVLSQSCQNEVDKK